MKRKILIIVIASLVTIALVTTCFLLFQKKDVVIKDTVKAIPQSAVFLIEIRNFETFYKEFVDQSPVFEKLKSLPAFKKANDCFERIESIAQNNEIANKILYPEPLLISSHISGKDNLNWFFAISLPSDIDEKTAISLMKNIFADSTSCTERQFENETIYDFKYNIGKQSLTVAVYGKILMWSHSGILIEEAISQLKSKRKSLVEEIDFISVYKSAGQKEIANIFVNTNKISPLISSGLNSDAVHLSDLIKQFGTWTEFDFELKNDLINLSGYTFVGESNGMLTNLAYSQELTENTIESVLPTNTVFYLRMSFTNSTLYVEKMNEYAKSLGQNEKNQNELNNFNQKYNIDIRNIIYPLIDSEIAIAVLTKQEEANQLEKFLIINTKSSTNAETEIKSLCEIFANNDKKNISDYVKQLKIDEGIIFNVYNLKANNIGQLLFGPAFSNVETNYVCFYNNYMIVGEDYLSLNNFVKMQFLNKTLGTDIKHSSFMTGFSKKSNLFIYFDLSRSKSLLLNFLNDNNKQIFEASFKELSQISDIAFQFSSNEGLLFNYAIIRFDPETRDEPHTIWASKLDSCVYSKPLIVVNHNTKGKEIIVQDEKNILHLIGESGREVWKIPIDGKILGDIYQVDAFKNDKLQYFFSTETHLHLIDRLGNYVDRFPIPLREKTSVGASLFDYDNNKSYRIVVPCLDKKVYLYDIEGKIVKGWEFTQTDNQVMHPAAFYRSGTNDYIIFNDTYNVYIINRKGVSKTNIRTNFKFSKNNPIIFDIASGSKSDRIIASSNNGTVYFMELTGSIDSLHLADYSENHFFTAYDIDNNGSKELIFIDGEKIEVFKQDKTKVFSLNLNAQIDDAPNFYKFSGNQVKIGLVSRKKETIFLLNADGTIFEGFPLKGVSPFSIGYINNLNGFFNLVCGGGENFLYNYQITER